MKAKIVVAAALAAAFALPLSSAAATFNYFAKLDPLNGSGVSGRANLSLNTDTNKLAVHVLASGLVPNQLHIQHIHGPLGPDGKPSQAVTPTFAGGADTDGDGVIELAEAAPFYGPILLSLTDDTKTGFDGFPTAPNGKINFKYTYDLSKTSAFGSNDATAEPNDTFSAVDLLPLSLREIVIHGGNLAAGQGFGLGEADGTAGYKTVLPVAVGQIAPVPLPASAWMLCLAVGGLGIAGMRRRGPARLSGVA